MPVLINKKASFSTLCETTDADIIIGTESCLTDEQFSSDIFPPGYKVFRKDRKKSKGGGVFIITKGTILGTEPEELTTPEDCEMLWLQITRR